FPDVLLARTASVSTLELGGEQRSFSVSLPNPRNVTQVPGSGTLADPFQLLLKAKGAVRVTVLDATGEIFPGANVTLHAPGARFPSVSGADGTVSFFGVPAGGLTAYAADPFLGFGGTSRATLTFDDQTVEMTVQLAPAVSAFGFIYEPTPEDREVDPSLRVPKAGAIVSLDIQDETYVVFTDENGYYEFPVLPVGGYGLSAQDNNGTQRNSVGGSLSGPNGNANRIPDLILDGSPPRILNISPPPGLEGVSRTSAVEILFSEPLRSNVLPSGSNGNKFRLRSANNVTPPGTWSHWVDAEGRQVVRFQPSQPYENVTAYSLTIFGSSNGVKDRIGRQLTQFGNVGSNFTTSDSVGPAVIGVVPELDRPVDPEASIRVDFNEAVVATDEQLDGFGGDDAAVIQALNGSGVWVDTPVTLFLTRQNYSLQVEPVQGLEIPGDTLRRRLIVDGLLDSLGNPMPRFEAEYRIYDENPPIVDAVPFPDNAPTGDLFQGTAYEIVPQLSGLDEVTDLMPGGDLDRVDYFFSDPEDPATPVQPSFSARTWPFKFSFVGAYVGDGVEPRPFPVWVQAVDTSTNVSNYVRIDMQVLPNAPPTVGGVSVEAT
ncbi:MAG: Ig-like domain-containing protein, partial [Acidobacteriota bacterium]